MAEALISAILRQLASFTAQQIQQERNLVGGAGQRAEELAGDLRAIKAVLEEAEKRQISEADVRHWLGRLKGASFEIDAALDDWNTAIALRSRLKPLEKVCFFTVNSCFGPNRVHQLGLRRRIARKIEEANEKLKRIAFERQNYMFPGRSERSEQRPAQTQTTSFVDMSEVHGREAEKEILVDMLFSDRSHATGREHQIVPIVGAGGIGKTTLAQLSYIDERIAGHFELKIWVCVSNPFDEFKIARAILEALGIGELRESVEFESLLQRIRGSISGRRFLLVLDDVWTEDDRKWSQLANCLAEGGAGSKILVTTRKNEVVVMMRAEDSALTLEHLSEEVCWSIFHSQAFFGKQRSEKLEEIGRQIASKSKGLPLAAKTLGSLMRFKDYSASAWEEVLKDELWKTKDFEDKVFVPLLFSYYDLPSLEKLCLLHCSYFPKDCTINRDELIEIWSSEGYFDGEEDHWRKGVDCFENLARRSFFQELEKDGEGIVVRCKMHDVVHDFVLFLARDEWSNKLIKDGEGTELGDGVVHCTILVESGARLPSSTYNRKTLRTLSVRNLSYQRTTVQWDSLLNVTCLRTLTLDRCEFSEVPQNIDRLVHLRYLSLENWMRTLALPKSLYNLINLKTLKLNGCVEELPAGIEKLVNLRHLHLGRYIRVPSGLRKLTRLETLDRLDVGTRGKKGKSNKRREMELGDLSKLNHLRGTLDIIGIGYIKDVGNAERAELKEKQGLVTLELGFLGDNSNEQQTSLLQGLHPHPNLRNLKISSYGGVTMFPSWMTSLIYLKTLKLDFCTNVEFLGPFGKLPSLESLTLNWMINVQSLGVEFLGITQENCSSLIVSFPRLKKLKLSVLSRCRKWEGPSCSGLITIMPCLVSLTIRDCFGLEPPLPEFLERTPLQNLTISGCDYLEQFYGIQGTQIEGTELEDYYSPPSASGEENFE